MTGTFRNIADLRTNELTVTRKGFWFSSFELTDGQFIYGELSYVGGLKRHARIETADGYWTVKRKGWLNRVMDLNRNEDETVGTITPGRWKSNIMLKMDNGFQTDFLRRAIMFPFFCWNHPAFGDLMTMKIKMFSFKSPYTITLDNNYKKNVQNDMPPLALLILLGINLMVQKHSQAAAGA